MLGYVTTPQTKSTWQRPLFVAFLVAFVFFFPWWMFVLLALFGIFYFKYFFEAPLAGLLFDLLYAIPAPNFFSFQYFFFAGLLAAMLFGEGLKKKVRV